MPMLRTISALTSQSEMRLKWTRAAMADIEKLLEYWGITSPGLQERKLDKLLAKVHKLEISPELGRVEPALAQARPRAGHRYVTEGFSKVIYRIVDPTVWVTQVLDSRSDPRQVRLNDFE